MRERDLVVKLFLAAILLHGYVFPELSGPRCHHESISSSKILSTRTLTPAHLVKQRRVVASPAMCRSLTEKGFFWAQEMSQAILSQIRGL
jgi:hypothetical protein